LSKAQKDLVEICLKQILLSPLASTRKRNLKKNSSWGTELDTNQTVPVVKPICMQQNAAGFLQKSATGKSAGFPQALSRYMVDQVESSL